MLTLGSVSHEVYDVLNATRVNHQLHVPKCWEGVGHVCVLFSSHAKILGIDESIPCLRFFCLFACLLVLKWRLARAHQLHTLGQDQSTVGQ